MIDGYFFSEKMLGWIKLRLSKQELERVLQDYIEQGQLDSDSESYRSDPPSSDSEPSTDDEPELLDDDDLFGQDEIDIGIYGIDV